MSVTLKIGIIGDYDGSFAPQRATNDALKHCGDSLGVSVEAEWLPTLMLEKAAEAAVASRDGIWCAPGAPESMEGALKGIEAARERDLPLIATCGGFQNVVLEYARDVLKMEGAQHENTAPALSNLLFRPCHVP